MSTALLGRHRPEPIRRYVTCQGPHREIETTEHRELKSSESDVYTTDCWEEQKRALRITFAKRSRAFPATVAGHIPETLPNVTQAFGAVHLDDMAALLAATPSPDGMEAILRFVDEDAKAAAFDHSWAELERVGTSHVDLDALKLCVRLLPPFSLDERVSTGQHRIV